MSVDNRQEKQSIIRWGIIGCGNVTEKKSGPAYQKTKSFELLSVMRRNVELAEDYAHRHNVPQFSSNADDIIHNPNIDAVYIATPPDSHKYYALQVAEVGKICCIEKPLSPSYQESLDIVKAFEDKNSPLFVAYYRRSLPRFNKVKTLLESGSIGVPRHISWHLSKPANALDLSGDYNWRTDRKIAFGGYFDDLASHGLDLFAYLLGEYSQVKGIALNQQALYSSNDAVSACWQHKSGVTGVGSWNFGSDTRHDEVTIYGSEGELGFSIFDDAAIHIQNRNQTEEIFIENPENIQLYHVNNMRENILNSTQHPSTGYTALHTSWVMDEILKNN